MIVFNISFAIIDFNSQSCYFGNLALNLFYWLVKVCWARLQGVKKLKWNLILKDLILVFIFIFMDDVANFGCSCEQ